MNPANRAILDECRQYYDFYKRTETLSGMYRISFHQLKELERIMSEEFAPGYTTRLDGCGSCVIEHLKRVYQSYDAWIAAQPVPKILSEEPLTVAATFPVNEPPTETNSGIITGSFEINASDPKQVIGHWFDGTSIREGDITFSKGTPENLDALKKNKKHKRK